MAAVGWDGPRAIPRTSRWEALMAGLALAHGAILYLMPAAPLIALGVWWNSNTISHNFIHRPFFRWQAANRLFGAYLSVLLGIPQALWRDRHLAHHARVHARVRISRELLLHCALVLGVWIAMAVRAPDFFFWVYAPGYLAGLGLCALQGYYEHAHGTTSHYGAIYNALFFNDGYHVEHHANPATHWTRLPGHPESSARASAWPAALRWMEALNLETLEKLTLAWPALRGFVLRAHERAIRGLAGKLPRVEQVAIVGGGLFPRSALILARLLPAARFTIIDESLANLDRARSLVTGNVEFLHATYPLAESPDCDLLVIPLAFRGDRAAIYDRPPAPAVIVHDWIWRRRGASAIVSLWMLKRVNLVVRP